MSTVQETTNFPKHIVLHQIWLLKGYMDGMDGIELLGWLAKKKGVLRQLPGRPPLSGPV
jgi:hypothetical protein